MSADPLDHEAVNAFESSLSRCLAQGAFVEAFYEKLLSSSAEVREKFSQTDFKKQKKILESSLYLMARACLGMDDGIAHLESVARTHSRRHLDIAPSHYKTWLECLIQTASEHDPDFDPSIERCWKYALQRGIDRMIDVYRSEQTLPPPNRVES